MDCSRATEGIAGPLERWSQHPWEVDGNSNSSRGVSWASLSLNSLLLWYSTLSEFWFSTHIFSCKSSSGLPYFAFLTLASACVHTKLLQACLTLCDPVDRSPSGSSVHGDSPGKNTGKGWVSMPSSRGSSPVRNRIHASLCLLHWQVGSLPLVPPGSPQNTGVISCSLLQAIFLTQGSNLNLLHCKQILDHLSHQERAGTWLGA